MRHYEIVVMVSADQHERGTAVAQRYQSMITDNGGVCHRFEDWGNRRLAYPIGKRIRARYFLFNIECGAEILNQLKDDFRYSESVIRSLVIRRDKAIIDDSKILQELKAAPPEEPAGGDEAPAAEASAQTDADADAQAKGGDDADAKAADKADNADKADKVDKAEAATTADAAKATNKSTQADGAAADTAADDKQEKTDEEKE